MPSSTQQVYQQLPAKLLSKTALSHSISAKEAKNAYLQCKAAAWVLFSEHRNNQENLKEADIITSEVMEVATGEEWRIARVVVQRNIIQIRGSRGQMDFLHEEVYAQLSNGVVHSVDWQLTVAMVLEEAKIQLKKYQFWQQKTFRETRKTHSRRDTKDIFVNAGLVKESESGVRRTPGVWKDPRKSYRIACRKLCSPLLWLGKILGVKKYTPSEDFKAEGEVERPLQNR